MIIITIIIIKIMIIMMIIIQNIIFLATFLSLVPRCALLAGQGAGAQQCAHCPRTPPQLSFLFCRGDGEARRGPQAAQGLQHRLCWLYTGRGCRPPGTASGGGRFKQPHDITLLSQIDPQGPSLLLPSLLPIAVIIFYFCKLIAFYIFGGEGGEKGGEETPFRWVICSVAVYPGRSDSKQAAATKNKP